MQTVGEMQTEREITMSMVDMESREESWSVGDGDCCCHVESSV
jgi:hypothetical protein